MRKIFIIIAVFVGAITILTAKNCAAENVQAPAAGVFTGTLNANEINVRSDANTNSAVICVLPKGENVEVILEKYGWYKIRLPKSARVFVKSSLFEMIDEKTAKAKGTNINVRIQPNQTSAILGRIEENEVVTVTGDRNGWLKIEPTANAFGWINTKFIDRKTGPAPAKQPEKIKPEATKPAIGESITVEGTIQPYGKVINRVATHKLIAKDYSVYLLKGSPDNFNSLTYHKVKITGKIISPANEKNPVIEVAKLEALD
ncbi:MAG: SH3 domain-containing protein [Candidatus Omnitrophota bacterium]